MRTETITSPSGWDMSDLLAIIEESIDSFTEGRRNNDMVNWFIIKRTIDIEKMTNAPSVIPYVDAFRELIRNLGGYQEKAIRNWSEDWERKLRVLFEHYGSFDRPQRLFNLWLPMEYDVKPTQVEGQLELT